MRTRMKQALLRLAAGTALLLMLSGCAYYPRYYDPYYGGYNRPYYGYPSGYYDGYNRPYYGGARYYYRDRYRYRGYRRY